jgi:hypothetical protein
MGRRAALAQVVDDRLAMLPPTARRRWLFARVHRRWPSFEPPRTFSEKVNWRILRDRRPELAWTCDKLQMKDHARRSGADIVVPATLWSGTDVRELADRSLPEHWVLKPSHRSGLVHFGGAGTDLDALAAMTQEWLTGVQHDTYAEWAYGQASRCLFVEELLGAPGSPPPDYKFFVFGGEPRMVQVDLDRFSGHRRSLYTPDWRLLPVELNYPGGGPTPRPARLDEMLEAARVLGRDYDFMRIDLYDTGGAVVFGEYTPYPGSGLERFRPRSFDRELGRLWTLPQV